MITPRLPLFQRLPEIYRIRDAEQLPPGQLEAFVGVLDSVQTALHDDIEALYHDLFIETCNPWVIPYIADLLGTSHLSGDPDDLRADVARTVLNRRRKGTLGAIESRGLFAVRLGGARGRNARAPGVDPAPQPSAAGRRRRATASLLHRHRGGACAAAR